LFVNIAINIITVKKIFGVITLFSVLALFGYVGYFLYKKSQQDPEKYSTTKPFRTSIVKKTVANGSIKPRKEVELKSQITGIIENLYVEAGQTVRAGSVIAKIKVIPDDVTLSNAEAALKQAKIRLQETKLEKERREKLFSEKVISEAEYNRYLFDYQRSMQEVEAAENNLQLIREGVSKMQAQTSTVVKATIPGMILDVPVKEGAQVIQSNNFNIGSTIAIIADMNDLIFEGKVDESEVGKLKEGMELQITVGAIEGKTFKAKLEYISPKGIDEEGTVQFQIKAAMTDLDSRLIRAGYSANADIILDSRDSVLAILERDILFEKDKKFVEVETGEQQFEKRQVETGLSDGINIEILSGISLEDKVKVQE